MSKPCYWLRRDKEPIECKVGGNNCPYSRMKWERCSEGQREYNKKREAKQAKTQKAKVIRAAVLNEICKTLTKNNEPGEGFPIHHTMEKIQELDLEVIIKELL